MNVLLALDNNLASSIALRYICRQAKFLPMTIQPFHVQEATQKHYPLGAGWVRNTWENAIVTTGESEVNNFIQSEAENCRGLSRAKIIVGDRSKEILSELESGFYDLYVQGLLSTFDAMNFYNLLKGRLLKRARSPVLLVKNLVQFSSVSILLEPGVNVERLISFYLKLYSEVDLPIDLVAYTLQGQGAALQEVKQEGPGYLLQAEEMLKSAGCTETKLLLAQGKPEDVANALRGVGMLVALFDRKRGKKSPLVDVLAHSLSPVLMFWR